MGNRFSYQLLLGNNLSHEAEVCEQTYGRNHLRTFKQGCKAAWHPLTMINYRGMLLAVCQLQRSRSTTRLAHHDSE